ASARRRAAWLETLVGSEQRVLVERADGRGHAENFAEVTVTPPRHVGRIARVRIIGVSDNILLGVPA
ncbi:MAG: tRNA (N(6)-L-threonylcarbamoyladenosine(37)-C(2))-methylthiotransferase MtaB, partial [Sphingomonadaceae bacterium]|nr:tRNA (N(6)-L-threonylcarbamoyladenosine(37)-C(2))-methylthiotransferase MtaB [Sphingomonadaceae bacterium]